MFFVLLPLCRSLGVIYKDGNDVPRDVRVARQWFEKAAVPGGPEAKQNLREMRRKCRNSDLARLPVTPTQNNGERRKHHCDGDDDQNAIEWHLTSP